MSLDNYLSESKIIDLRNGKKIEINPLNIKQISKFLRLLNELNLSTIQDTEDTNNLNIILNRIEGSRSIVNIACGFSDDLIDELNAAEYLNILNSIIEVNSDFFIKSVNPLLQNLTTNIQKIMVGMNL